MNYVITSCNQSYWCKFGSTWLGTLKSSGYSGSIIIFIDGAFSLPIYNQLQENGIILLPLKNLNPNKRINCWLHIAEYAANTTGNYFYFDIDCEFQSGLPSIKPLKFSITSNPGLLAGESEIWKLLKYITTAVPDFAHNVFFDSFPYFLNYVGETWNFHDLPKSKVKDGQLYYQDKLINVIHPRNQIRNICKGRGVLFEDRQIKAYKEFKAYFNKVPKIKQKLIKNVSTSSNLGQQLQPEQLP